MRWEISRVCDGREILRFIQNLEHPVAIIVFGAETDLKEKVITSLRKHFDDLGNKSVLISIDYESGNRKDICVSQEEYEGYDCLKFNYANVIGIMVKTRIPATDNARQDTPLDSIPSFRHSGQDATYGIDWLITVNEQLF